MLNRFFVLLVLFIALFPKHANSETVVTVGKWIIDEEGKTMLDPQTSGLLAIGDTLYSLSDGSAHSSQQKALHRINMRTAAVEKQLKINAYSSSVQSSCFYTYLSDEPDYEAMVKHPLLADRWIWVTEDASRSEPLDAECQRRYDETGSTEYPTLLVLLKQNADSLEVEGVRPLQFPIESKVGNYPNDGIEGLAVTKNNKLLLGLEKDSAGSARVFSVSLGDDTFKNDEFLKVEDAGLLLPSFSEGNHPINGMDVYYPNDNQGFLIAAARNDNELWIVDLNKTLPVRREKLVFKAPAAAPDCPDAYVMDNASIEGVAVSGSTLFLINDPWKVNYKKNIKCSGDSDGYERNSPLLFEIPLKELGF